MRLGKTSRHDRAVAVKYLAIGTALRKTARDLNTLADAVIAYCDAVSIAYREIKSADGDHRRAADVLAHALGNRAESDQIDRVTRILDAKTHASYSGNYYSLEEAQRIFDQAERFMAWAEDLYNNRPS